MDFKEIAEKFLATAPAKFTTAAKSVKQVVAAREKDALGQRRGHKNEKVNELVYQLAVVNKRPDACTTANLATLTGLPEKQIKPHLAWLRKQHQHIFSTPVIVPPEKPTVPRASAQRVENKSSLSGLHLAK